MSADSKVTPSLFEYFTLVNPNHVLGYFSAISSLDKCSNVFTLLPLSTFRLRRIDLWLQLLYYIREEIANFQRQLLLSKDIDNGAVIFVIVIFKEIQL